MSETIVRVRLRGRGKSYDFSANGLDLSKGDIVVVETAQGLEIGVVSTVVGPTDSDQERKRELKPVLRCADPSDLRTYREIREAENRAFEIAEGCIEEHGLDMVLVDVEYRFDRRKITFFFTADGRVDFRRLVKDLASIFRTRIELRQIGVRDKARMVGGLGLCGRELCCSTFLREFRPVSIRMAKEQNLSMNPAKISGACGRLLCCLNFEQAAYADARKRLPKKKDKVMTPDGPGTVDDINLITERVTVLLDEREEDNRVTYEAADLTFDKGDEPTSPKPKRDRKPKGKARRRGRKKKNR